MTTDLGIDRRHQEYIRDYIRNYYNVPAEFGGRVAYTWRGRSEGTITGFENGYLLVRMDDADIADLYHPKWEIEYL